MLRPEKQKINNTKSWFFKNINKIGKPLAKLRKERKDSNESRDITTNTKEIHRILRNYSKQLYTNKFDNPEEM